MMKVNSISLDTKHYLAMRDFLTNVLEWELNLGEKKSECNLENIKFILKKEDSKRDSGEVKRESLEFQVEINELKDLKSRLELFLYSNPEYKNLFEQEFLKIDLRKESQLEIQDPDKRTWMFRGKH